MRLTRSEGRGDGNKHINESGQKNFWNGSIETEAIDRCSFDGSTSFSWRPKLQESFGESARNADGGLMIGKNGLVQRLIVLRRRFQKKIDGRMGQDNSNANSPTFDNYPDFRFPRNAEPSVTTLFVQDPIWI